jgi:hypothetical protein
MRSKDAMLGLATDVAFFTTLQLQMLEQLQNVYPDLKLGRYTHKVDSLHLYERDFEKVEEMLKHAFVEEKMADCAGGLITRHGSPKQIREMFWLMTNNLSLDEAKLSEPEQRSVMKWIHEHYKPGKH